MTTPKKESIAAVNVPARSLKTVHPRRFLEERLGECDPKPELLRNSFEISHLKSLPSPMPDMQHHYRFALFNDAVDHAINAMLAPIEQVPDCLFLGRYRTPVGKLFQTENLFLQPCVPLSCGIGADGVDFVIQVLEVALRAGSDTNQVCHAGLRIHQKTAWPAGPSLFWSPPTPVGFPPCR